MEPPTTSTARMTAEATSTNAAGPGAQPVLTLDAVTTTFDGNAAVEDVSLQVRDGELLTIIGPSGCGKTTLLRTIAGLERPDVGRVSIEGETVSGPERFVQPENRDVGLVFQDFALFSHLSVAENVGFGIDDWPAAERAARVEELLELVGLAGAGDRSPTDLSGGQKQRVALARALAPEPTVLLLDEPFSSLDRDLRERMRAEVSRILRAAEVTTIFVTHDQTEALSMSDRVAVLYTGSLEQVGRPETVFTDPASRVVAEFLGTPTFLAGTVETDHVSTAIGPIGRDQLPGLEDRSPGTCIDVIVRPDDLLVEAVPESAADGVVRHRSYEGSTIRYRVVLGTGTTVQAMHNHTSGVALGDPVAVRLVADHEFAWFPARDRDGCS